MILPSALPRRLGNSVGWGRGVFTMEVGDCEVILNNASKMAFTITPSLLGIDLPFTIPIHEPNAFIITSESIIIIKHAVYEGKMIKFDGEYILWVKRAF
jgi:hypothetical protein